MAGTERSAPRRILVVVVNTTAAKTGTVVAAARRIPDPATEIVGLTPRSGAPSVEDAGAAVEAATGVPVHGTA